MDDLIKAAKEAVSKSNDLKNKFTYATDAPVEFGCVFCQTPEEYEKFTNTITPLDRIVEDTPSGYTYLLKEPIETVSGPLRLLKIRKPDPKRKERGDADFNTNYEEFSSRYQSDPRFKIVEHKTFKYLRLEVPGSGTMACFSNRPKSKVLGLSG